MRVQKLTTVTMVSRLTDLHADCTQRHTSLRTAGTLRFTLGLPTRQTLHWWRESMSRSWQNLPESAAASGALIRFLAMTAFASISPSSSPLQSRHLFL